MNELIVEFKIPKGRPRKYSPSELLHKFQEYLDTRAGQNIHLKEEETANYSNGTSSNRERSDVRLHPLSIADFCIFLGNCRNWWNELPEDFLGVKAYISDYLEAYQLKGAMVGAFNANIVSRLLGLTDKKEIVADGLQIIVNSQEEKGKIDNIDGLGI